MYAVNVTDQRWNQVLGRERSADGSFVYAVKSTGIFCRPTCPSRRPRREQVEFFNSPAEAQIAGYRACRRCSPAERDPQLRMVERACRFIDENLDVTLTLPEVAQHAGCSPFHFQRIFKRMLGISPREYQQARRAGKFKQTLRNGSRITDAIYEAGYGSSSRLYENVSSHLGMTPGNFQKKGADEEISYTTFASALGRVLLAATERGICAVQLGANEQELVRDLRKEFEAATIRAGHAKLAPLVQQVKMLIDGAQQSREIPLDIRGTAFQKLVWEALRRIPRGQTRSYSEIARSIGQPRAVRAVAGACAANRLAVVIPCHRVVQKTGKISGYRWGVKRKRELLQREAAQASR